MKTQLSEIMQSDEFLEKRLAPLLKNVVTLFKNVFKALAKHVLDTSCINSSSRCSNSKETFGSEYQDPVWILKL